METSPAKRFSIVAANRFSMVGMVMVGRRASEGVEGFMLEVSNRAAQTAAV